MVQYMEYWDDCKGPQRHEMGSSVVQWPVKHWVRKAGKRRDPEGNHISQAVHLQLGRTAVCNEACLLMHCGE